MPGPDIKHYKSKTNHKSCFVESLSIDIVACRKSANPSASTIVPKNESQIRVDLHFVNMFVPVPHHKAWLLDEASVLGLGMKPGHISRARLIMLSTEKTCGRVTRDGKAEKGGHKLK